MDEFIYHIAIPEHWEAEKARGSYAVESLQKEGFIHCSTERQVPRSLNKFYAGKSVVVVLKLEAARLQSELKYEPADNDSFPHLYGELNLDAVLDVQRIVPDSNGTFHFP